MTPAAALRSQAAVAPLDRLARGLMTGIAVRWYSEGREGPVIVHRETDVRAAAWIEAHDAARSALQATRLEVADACLRRGQLAVFLDTMGFAHVCAPFGMDATGSGFCLMAGPFCSLEGLAAREDDIRSGLARLGEPPSQILPFPLYDLTIVPMETALTLADWAAHTLDGIVAEARSVSANPERAPEPRKPTKWTPNTPRPAPYDADMLAAAMAAGESARLRAILRAEVAESEGRVRVKQAVARARVLAALAAGLEGAERAGLATKTAWERMPKALDEIRDGADAHAWVDAAMRVFGAIARKKARQPKPDPQVSALHDWLVAHMPEGVTLNDAAAALGENPTAITHRLQRKFGMSFTQYVNRLRLDKAKDLLRTTKLPIAAIAQRVGVGDPSNLGRIFRSIEHMSPGEYRKRFGKEG